MVTKTAKSAKRARKLIAALQDGDRQHIKKRRTCLKPTLDNLEAEEMLARLRSATETKQRNRVAQGCPNVKKLSKKSAKRLLAPDVQVGATFRFEKDKFQHFV
ncbi:hypothetical protein L915_07524, partial [Phytophthora nicotianae]